MLIGFKAQNHPQQVAKDDVDDRALPPGDFATLDKRFGFTIDVAAAPHNAKLPRFYSASNSGLEASWKGERVYCNPPFSDIAPWVRKAHAETEAEVIVMLLPANRTEQGWWHDLVEPYRDKPNSRLSLEFIKGRQRFLRPHQSDVEPNNRPPFGCCLLIWWKLATGANNP